MVALVMTLALSVLTYYPLHLGGQWLLYWFVYFQTTCIGIGAPRHDTCSWNESKRECTRMVDRSGLVRVQCWLTWSQRFRPTSTLPTPPCRCSQMLCCCSHAFWLP